MFSHEIPKMCSTHEALASCGTVRGVKHLGASLTENILGKCHVSLICQTFGRKSPFLLEKDSLIDFVDPYDHSLLLKSVLFFLPFEVKRFRTRK